MLRLATPDDLELIKELIGELIEDSKNKGILSLSMITDEALLEFTNVENQLNKVMVFVVDEDKVVGLGAFEAVRFPHVDLTAARLSAIYVKPEYRNKGYAKEINQAFEYWGKAVGCSVYNINVSTETDLTKYGYSKHEVVYIKKVE